MIVLHAQQLLKSAQTSRGSDSLLIHLKNTKSLGQTPEWHAIERSVNRLHIAYLELDETLRGFTKARCL